MSLISEASILSNKRVALSNPGTKLNDLYYTKENSTVDLVECTFSTGRFKQTLSSPVFGGSSQVNIPNGSFLGTCYLHLELPTMVNATANLNVNRGWGYAAINNISFLFGSSNVSQLQISGQSIMHLLMSQSETSDKISEYFNLGGEATWPDSVGTPPNGPASYVSADLLLPFPWSSFNALCSKKEFDTDCLRNPITINITFNPASSFIGGVADTAIAAYATQFSKAQITCRQGDLTNKDLSLGTRLNMFPELMYAYPFIHTQSFQSQSFTGVTAGNGSATVQLSQFINADLVAIVFSVVKNSYLTKPSGAALVANPFVYDEIRDLQLTRNGQVIYDAPGYANKLINMHGMYGGSAMGVNLVTGSPGSTPTQGGVPSYCTIVDFSRLRSTFYCDGYQNVLRIPNQVLSLNLNTTSTDTYTLFATYFYDGVNEVQASESRIIFS
jgi:hypothetical protein